MSFKRTGLLLLMVAAAFLSSFYYLKTQTSHKAIDNIHHLSALESFILASQKTRGLTNSYLNGNLSAQLLVYGQREKIIQSIQDMEKHSDTSLLGTTKQKQIATDIIKLNQLAFKEDPRSVFSHYTDIIDMSIDFGKELENKMVQNDPSYKAIFTIAFPLIENIAKLRGLGSGCVAHRSSTNIEHEKLTSLILNINKFQYLLVENGSNSQSEKESLERIVYSIQRYVKFSQDEIINRRTITIGADFYFDQGTAVIDSIVKYLDKQQAKQITTLNS